MASGNRTDISLDDPNFWDKWAKKAEIDVEMVNGRVSGPFVLMCIWSSCRCYVLSVVPLVCIRLEQDFRLLSGSVRDPFLNV